MTIEEYINEVTTGLNLDPALAQKITADLAAELRAEVAAGKSEDEATAGMDNPEIEAARLMQKYDSAVQAKQTSEGKLPMVFWWAVMLSCMLFGFKLIQLICGGTSTFNIVGFAVGAVGLVGCGIFALLFGHKNKK